MSNISKGAHELHPGTPEPNRFISGSLKRGTRIIFNGTHNALNIATELTAADIAALRDEWGHAIIEDPGETPAGTVTEAELRTRYEFLSAVCAKAKAEGDMRTYYQNEEAMRMASYALNDAIARRSAPTAA